MWGRNALPHTSSPQTKKGHRGSRKLLPRQVHEPRGPDPQGKAKLGWWWLGVTRKGELGCWWMSLSAGDGGRHSL